MIPIGRPEHLGTKTLVMNILRGIFPAIILLVFVITLDFSQDYILETLTQDTVVNGSTMPSLSKGLLPFLPVFIPAIFFLSIILGGLSIIISVLQYRFFTFTLEEFGIRLKKGVLRVEEVSIPYRQMQDIDITRPIIYRLFGISRLVIFSAGHEQPNEPEQTNTVFDPIDSEIANGIKEILNRRIGIQIIQHESEADRKEMLAKSLPSIDL